ncbi:hypothetical protein ASU31_04720 [Pedobacter ginsenosidimutans]|uniref:Uncharacterized protein n=1 Tax=Pedobacter ginsenosidimutans TaxID=687842 RepID=A0A0T5VSY0_9SPHI|nr:hypothetical protein ASU31_04720 [Pedobacter ginsenosidimutans]
MLNGIFLWINPKGLLRIVPRLLVISTEAQRMERSILIDFSAALHSARNDDLFKPIRFLKPDRFGQQKKQLQINAAAL